MIRRRLDAARAEVTAVDAYDYVVVNDRFAVDAGASTDVRAGRAVRHQPRAR